MNFLGYNYFLEFGIITSVAFNLGVEAKMEALPRSWIQLTFLGISVKDISHGAKCAKLGDVRFVS